MHGAGDLVRETRRGLGLTQTELAVTGGVSLATVQTVEAGRANPSLRTLERILSPLGLALEVTSAAADWDALAALGLPLTTSSSPEPGPAVEELPHLVRCAAVELSRRADLPDRERRRECLEGFLLALRGHFPTRFARWFGRSELIEGLVPRRASGRVIRLSRIARDTLARLL